jgi:DNA-directed RNA polymerase specialized sigma24 family protein
MTALLDCRRMTRLGSRLDREWLQLRCRPALLRHAAGWAIVEGPLHDLDQILAAVGYQVAWTARNEAAMRALVLRAADDELAARIAIQRILPGLLAVVRRRRAADAEGLDELIGAAWIGVRTFNPARRSRCVAAALIADADYRAFRAGWRRRCSGERPTGLTPDLAYDEPVETTAQVLADLLARAELAGVPDDDIELIRRAAEDDATTEQLARELNVTARTVRNRRARVTDRLRQLAAAA